MASLWRTWRDELAGGAGRHARAKLDLRALAARAPTAASVVLGIAIAAQAAQMAFALSGEFKTAAIAGTDAMARAQARGQHGIALADITSAHLFGFAPQAITASNAGAVSRSPLVLTGIIATEDPHDGFAIVGASTASTRTVYVGSEAAPGTILLEVHPLWVILERGGERLTLRLPRKDLMGAAGRNNMQQLAQSAREAAAADADDGSNPGGAFYLPAEPLQKPATPNAGVVVRAFDLLPTSVAGERGMRISGTGLNRKVLASLGLQGGDVITQINGIPMSGPKPPDLIDAIQAGDVTLTVVKNGEASSVTLDPTSVASAAALYRQADPDY